MPELPEVESARRVLARRLIGQVALSRAVFEPTFYRRPDESVLKGIAGKALECVERRGKYLLFRFSSGKTLVLHLGMSGRLSLNHAGKHARLKIRFSKDALYFCDARRFGRAGCRLPALGPEPLSQAFNADYLWRASRRRRLSIKALIMDQTVAAGLGNIYATEALFRAGVLPQRRAGSLSHSDAAALSRSIKEVLREAVRLGGTTLADRSYLDPLGRPGRFQDRLRLYGKNICPSGHRVLKTRTMIAGRRAFYCAACTKP